MIPSEEASKLLQVYIIQKAKENNGFIDGDGRRIRNLTQKRRNNQADRLTLLDQAAITIELLQEVEITDIPKD